MISKKNGKQLFKENFPDFRHSPFFCQIKLPSKVSLELSSSTMEGHNSFVVFTFWIVVLVVDFLAVGFLIGGLTISTKSCSDCLNPIDDVDFRAVYFTLVLASP